MSNTTGLILPGQPGYDQLVSSKWAASQAMEMAPTSFEAMADILAAYLQYNPQLAEQSVKLAEQYEPRFAELGRRLQGEERAGDIADILRLAPELQRVREAAERPEATQMRDLLFEQILGALQRGEELTPEQERGMTQGTRSAQMARGLGTGQGSANREAVKRALEGQRVLQERQGAAAGLLAQEATQQTDPFLAILGRPATATTLAAQQTAGSGITAETAMQNYWQAQNNANQQNAYNLQLQIARANPELRGFRM